MTTVHTIERDRGFNRAVEGLKTAKGSFVDIGVFGGRNPAGESILAYAIANEFGTENIPERSFLRSTVDENRSAWLDELESGLMKIALGQATAKGVLTTLGIKIREAIKKKIRDLREPPNAPSTIASKGSSNPLVNRGDLRRAIEYKLGNVFDAKTGKIITR